MAKLWKFEVEMEVADDDQTDPDVMAAVLTDVLNCRGGATADWQSIASDYNPEYRPKFRVQVETKR